MLRISVTAAFVSLFLSLPASLIAGGPPRLWLPIDGVSAANAKKCTELLGSKLKDKIWSQGGQEQAVQLQQRANQWYVMFPMGEDVGLQEIDTALQGSSFSIPRDKLRFFGHVILEIETRQASPQELLAALDAVEHVSITESKSKKGHLLVTVDMPYPVGNRAESESFAWDKFQWGDFSSDQSNKAKSPVTARMLPSLAAFREVVAKHHGHLKDIRWSNHFACRALGCVIAPETGAKISANLFSQD